MAVTFECKTTIETDRVSFQAPVAGLGWAVERALLSGYMKKLIEERGTYLKRAAEGRTQGSST